MLTNTKQYRETQPQLLQADNLTGGNEENIYAYGDKPTLRKISSIRAMLQREQNTGAVPVGANQLRLSQRTIESTSSEASICLDCTPSSDWQELYEQEPPGQLSKRSLLDRRYSYPLADRTNYINPKKPKIVEGFKSVSAVTTDVKPIAAAKFFPVLSSDLVALTWIDQIMEEQNNQDNNKSLPFIKEHDHTETEEKHKAALTLGEAYTERSLEDDKKMWMQRCNIMQNLLFYKQDDHTETEEDPKTALERIEAYPELSLSQQERVCLQFCNKEMVGKGLHGVVYALPAMANFPRFHEEVLKECSLRVNGQNYSKAQQTFINEASYLCRFRHPNIIRLAGFCTTSCYTYLILEKKQNSLREYIRSERTKPFKTCKKMMCDMIAGIDYLHSQKIIHRDIHLSNFLVDKKGTVLVADLGMAAHLSDGYCLNKNPPVFCAAPELTYKSQAIQSISSDIFSLGFSMQGLLAWRSWHIAWFTPELKAYNETMIKNDTLRFEAHIFCQQIASWKAENPGVKKMKWTIHEVMPKQMFVNRNYSPGQHDVANALGIIKRAMAYNPQKRPDTQVMMQQLLQ